MASFEFTFNGRDAGLFDVDRDLETQIREIERQEPEDDTPVVLRMKWYLRDDKTVIVTDLHTVESAVDLYSDQVLNGFDANQNVRLRGSRGVNGMRVSAVVAVRDVKMVQMETLPPEPPEPEARTFGYPGGAQLIGYHTGPPPIDL